VCAGAYSRRPDTAPDNFAALKARIAETLAALEAIEASEVDAFVGRDMRFTFGDRNIDFTAENFLLSFSQPNFLLPRDHDLRHPALEGDSGREARFHGKLRMKR